MKHYLLYGSSGYNICWTKWFNLKLNGNRHNAKKTHFHIDQSCFCFSINSVARMNGHKTKSMVHFGYSAIAQVWFQSCNSETNMIDHSAPETIHNWSSSCFDGRFHWHGLYVAVGPPVHFNPIPCQSLFGWIKQGVTAGPPSNGLELHGIGAGGGARVEGEGEQEKGIGWE